MAYATKEEVKSLFRDFADNSEAAVVDTELDLYLNNTTAIIDSRLKPLYKLPLTELANPMSFKILKMVQMFKVACIVDDILNNYSEADKKPMWCKKAEMLLNSFAPERDKNSCKQCEPTSPLPDAEYLFTDSQRARIKISSTRGTVFRKGYNNW